MRTSGTMEDFLHDREWQDACKRTSQAIEELALEYAGKGDVPAVVLITAMAAALVKMTLEARPDGMSAEDAAGKIIMTVQVYCAQFIAQGEEKVSVN